MTTFDRFSERTRRALALAQAEARGLDQSTVNTAHLLLGVLGERDSISVRALQAMGMDVDDLRGFTRSILHTGLMETEGEGLSQPAKLVLQHAIDESRQLGSELVEPEHVLLGMIRTNEGYAGNWLRSQGVSLETARAEIGRGQDLSAPSGDQPTGAQMPPPRAHEVRSSNPVPFSRFSERARTVLEMASAEATRLNHDYVGTEHLLLALVREGEGVGARALTAMGAQLIKIQVAIEFIVGRGEPEPPADAPGLTPRSKKVLELAVDESRRMGHDHVGTEHLLLGLVREGEGIAGGVLESVGVTLDKARAQVLKLLEGPPEPSTGDT
jgi:ATP-dependent Clp protease ATP-binding subunit ClpA